MTAGPASRSPTPDAPDAPHPPPTPGPVDHAGRWVWALALVAALPALVAGAAAIGAPWVPGADHAPIEVRVRDVSSADPPLVGAYSRVGGNHPGPAMFYALAGPYRLSGAHPWGLLVGAALLNASLIVLAVRIAGRRGRVGLAAATTAAVLVLARSLGPDGLRDPWNPSLALLAFCTAALASWAVATGSRRSLPVAAVTISFCAQAHVGYLPLALVLAAWCAVGLARHRHDLRAWRVPGLVAAGALAVMWLPVLGQQLFGEAGNLTAIVGNVNDTGEPEAGLRAVWDVLLPHLGPWPRWPRPGPWTTFEISPTLGVRWPPVGAAVLVGAVVVAVRRRDRDAGTLLAVTVSLWVAGALAITQLSGLSGAYLYRWVRVLGLLLWLAALWTLGRALAERAGRVRATRVPPTVPLAAVVLLAGLAVAVAAATVGTPFAQARSDSVERQQRIGLVAEAAEGAVAGRLPAGATVEVREAGATLYVAPATVARLERSGYHVLVDQLDGAVWGGHRRPEGRVPDAVVTVTTEDPQVLRAAGNPARVVATVDQLTPQERREYETLGPPSPRCRALVDAAVASVDPRPDPILEACQRRIDLAGRDHHVSVLIGP